MKKFLLYSLLCSFGWLCGFSSVSADEVAVASAEPAVLNHPLTAWKLTKAVVDYTQPGYDWNYLFSGGEPFNGVSTALLNLKPNNVLVGSLRVGYGTDGDQSIYGGPSLDLPGFASFIPQQIKDWSPALVDQAFSLAAKYGRAGFLGGYSVERSEWLWGGNLGAQVTLNF